MVKAVNRFLADNYIVRKPSFKIRTAMTLLYGVKVLSTPILPKGLQTMTNEITSVRELELLYMMNKFVKQVRKETLHSLNENHDNIWQTTFNIAEKLKSQFFELSEPQQKPVTSTVINAKYALNSPTCF